MIFTCLVSHSFHPLKNWNMNSWVLYNIAKWQHFFTRTVPTLFCEIRFDSIQFIVIAYVTSTVSLSQVLRLLVLYNIWWLNKATSLLVIDLIVGWLNVKGVTYFRLYSAVLTLPQSPISFFPLLHHLVSLHLYHTDSFSQSFPKLNSCGLLYLSNRHQLCISHRGVRGVPLPL